MRKTMLVIMAIGCIATVGSGGTTQYAMAAKPKVWTVTDRQVELRKRVDKGLKDNELTAKEAKKFAEQLDNLEDSINKMKTKNDGKLSYKDEGKVEKRLNEISLDIEKKQLAKRVTAR